MLQNKTNMKSEKNNVKMIMQVHDELVFEMSADNAQNYAQKICLMMEEAATLSAPLIVDIGIGDNWQEAH